MFTVRRPYGKRLSFVRCYTVQIMKWTIFIVLFASVAFAQNDMGNSRATSVTGMLFMQANRDSVNKEPTRSQRNRLATRVVSGWTLERGGCSYFAVLG